MTIGKKIFALYFIGMLFVPVICRAAEQNSNVFNSMDANAQHSLSCTEYQQEVRQEIDSVVKTLRPIFLYGFITIFLFLFWAAIKTKKLRYILALINFLIVSPFTYLYITSPGKSMGFELMIPLLLDLPFFIIGEAIARGMFLLFLNGDLSEFFYRSKAILEFPILGTIQWYLIGYYFKKSKGKK